MSDQLSKLLDRAFKALDDWKARQPEANKKEEGGEEEEEGGEEKEEGGEE